MTEGGASTRFKKKKAFGWFIINVVMSPTPIIWPSVTVDRNLPLQNIFSLHWTGVRMWNLSLITAGSEGRSIYICSGNDGHAEAKGRGYSGGVKQVECLNDNEIITPGLLWVLCVDLCKLQQWVCSHTHIFSSLLLKPNSFECCLGADRLQSTRRVFCLVTVPHQNVYLNLTIHFYKDQECACPLSEDSERPRLHTQTICLLRFHSGRKKNKNLLFRNEQVLCRSAVFIGTRCKTWDCPLNCW